MRSDPRRARCLAAVLVAWGAGLVLSSRVERRAVVPLAIVLALPLAAVFAIRTWSPPPSRGAGDERSAGDT